MFSYSLRETELFLRSLLNEEPVKTVVAPEAPRSDHHRAASKERAKVFTIQAEKENKGELNTEYYTCFTCGTT